MTAAILWGSGAGEAAAGHGVLGVCPPEQRAVLNLSGKWASRRDRSRHYRISSSALSYPPAPVTIAFNQESTR